MSEKKLMMEGSSSIVLHFVHRDTQREKVGPCMFLLCGTLLFKGGTQSNKESECPTLTYFCVFFFKYLCFQILVLARANHSRQFSFTYLFYSLIYILQPPLIFFT